MYGDLYALNRLNLTLDQGDVYGFIGPNGAGKTTTMRILATLLNPTWGPHAKFHDFVSDMAGVYCGLAALFYLFRRGARSIEDLRFSNVVQTIFWISLLSGFLWPGAGGTASEHPEIVPKVLGVRLNEAFISVTTLAAMWVTYPFERRRRAQ